MRHHERGDPIHVVDIEDRHPAPEQSRRRHRPVARDGDDGGVRGGEKRRFACAAPHLDLVVAAPLVALDQHEVGRLQALEQPIQRRLAVIAGLAQEGEAIRACQHDVAGAGSPPRVGGMALGQ